MKTNRIVLAVVLAAVVVLVGCKGGPALAFSLDLNQGPRLQVQFGATPIGMSPTNAPKINPP